MKIAFISDIHANLPALEKVLADIGKQPPDLILCLGDLVNFAGWDNEVIALVRSRNIPVIQGNHDEGIAYNRSRFPFSFSGKAQEEFGIRSIEYVNKTISEAHRSFLAGLPFSFSMHIGNQSLLMVHGSPKSNLDYMQEGLPDEKWKAFLPETPTDIICMGHTHLPYHRILPPEVVPWNRPVHLINAGSVGKPKHGNNKACYALVEIEAAQIKKSFHFVAYPVKQVMDHLHTLGFGDAYTSFLKHGSSGK